MVTREEPDEENDWSREMNNPMPWMCRRAVGWEGGFRDDGKDDGEEEGEEEDEEEEDDDDDDNGGGGEAQRETEKWNS